MTSCPTCGSAPDVKLLGVADSEPVGVCPACGVLRVHVRLESLGIVRGDNIQAIMRVTGPDGAVARIAGPEYPIGTREGA